MTEINRTQYLESVRKELNHGLEKLDSSISSLNSLEEKRLGLLKTRQEMISDSIFSKNIKDSSFEQFRKILEYDRVFEEYQQRRRLYEFLIVTMITLIKCLIDKYLETNSIEYKKEAEKYIDQILPKIRKLKNPIINPDHGAILFPTFLELKSSKNFILRMLGIKVESLMMAL